ncbi:MAG: sterol desaturase family protein [Litorimonas sp.]
MPTGSTERAAWHGIIQNIGLLALNGVVWTFCAYLFAGVGQALPLPGKMDPFGTWPLFAQTLAMLLIFDLAYYINHRMIHTKWLWPIHVLHHSDRAMTFSTAYRIHILQGAHFALLSLVLIGWLSLPAEAAALTFVIRNWYGMYVHSRLPVRHGWLEPVLVSPNYHRWHHADDPDVYGKNLADMFPVWDILFGTHHRAGWCDVPLGVSGAPDDIFRAQLHPFARWRDLWRGRTGAPHTEPDAPVGS